MKRVCISKILLIMIGFAVLAAYSGQWEVFTNKNDVQDIALSGTTLWAATTGGVVAWNLVDTTYTSYTTVDGLSSCNINQIAVDNKGRPWVATKEPAGLFVYENDTWKQIKVGGDDSEITYEFITGLEIDRFGNVWVCTRGDYIFYTFLNDEILWHYDGQKWHKHEGVYGPLALDMNNHLLAIDSMFSTEETGDPVYFRIVSFDGSEFINRWRRKVEAEGELGYVVLAHIAQDSKGNPWISYFGERMGGTYGVVCNNTLYNTLDGLADDNVRSITADEAGTVWCATDGGISKFTEGIWVTYDTTKGVASNLVNKILIDSNNILYAATSKGISILQSNQWKTLKTINEPLHNNYTDMVVDNKNMVILASGDHIAIYNNVQWKIDYVKNIHFKGSIYYPDDPVSNRSFITSEDGTLYAIGNEIQQGHILKQETGGSSFYEAFSCMIEKNNPILLPAVACSSTDSCFWLTDEDGNLIWFNKQKVSIFFPSQFGSGGGVGSIDNRISCMLLDRDGRSVWFGYSSGGIFHFDGVTIKKQIYASNGLASSHMSAIARDSSENLWFATASVGFRSGGVAVLRNTELTSYTEDRDGKMFGGCNNLFVDKLGMVWTHADKGIARFDGTSWKLFDSTVVSPNLPYYKYSQIIQDKSGTVWFGTNGCGLLAYKDNRWYQFTTRDGIPDNRIRSLAVDRKNNLWILTNSGVAMRKSDELVRNQFRRDFKNQENKQIIQQRGNRFYVSSDNKPRILRYTQFDLSGRTVHKQTIHDSKSFMLPQNRVGSGVRILSITTVDADKSQKKYVLKMSDINK